MGPLVPRGTKGSCEMVARDPLDLGVTQNQKAISDLGTALSDLASALSDLCRTILTRAPLGGGADSAPPLEYSR